MAINESVYGSKENWYVPIQHSEFGETQPSEVSYYNQIDADDKLKIKVANYNTLENPVTTMRSQISGQYSSYSYLIRNDWVPTEFTMDNSIVQFGIGSQSGLSKQEWWYVDREQGASDPSTDTPPVLKNTDTYDLTNMCLATTSNYTPFEFYSFGQGSILGGYDNRHMYWQVIRGQTFGAENSYFDDSYDNTFKYGTGYIYSKLVTQIPIKNLKLTPVIYAYNTALDNYKKFTSIQDYLDEKGTYPNIFCIKAQFRYRNGYTNDAEYNSAFSCYPWFFNPSSFLNGYGYRFNNQDSVYSDNIYYPNRGDKEISEGITVAGRPGYGYGPNGSMLGNEIYWYGHNDSSSSNSFTIGQGGRVLQTPDFKFELGTKNLFYCNVSNMTNDQITEGIRTQLASFGLFFVDGSNDLDLPLDDEKTFLGILEDGVAYGKYSNGSKNREQDQWNWDTMEENSYDPSNPPKTDPNTYESTSGFNPAINAPDGFNKRYVLSEIDIRTLREDFFQALESKPEDIDYINYTMSEFLTNNPIDCIVSLKWFPFTVPSHGQEVNINLGNYQTNVQAPVYTGSGVEVYSLGSCVIYPYAGSGEPCFLDYAPYTKIELIIPYCGTVELDPSIYMNHTLSVNFIVDIYTGACTAYIMCDGLVSDSVSGVCCVDLPISGIDNATLEGQIYNASLNLKSSKIGEAVSVVNGGLSFGTSLLGVKGSGAKMAKGVVGTVDALTGAIGSVAQSSESLAMNQYQIEHINIPFRTIGSQTGLGNAKQEQFCRVLIYRPKFINGLTNARQWYNSNEGKLYGHTVGYSCIKTDVISSFHGFTMFSNVDLSGINATDSEKAAILTALQSGVILP